MHPHSYGPTVVVVPQSPPASSQALPALCNFFCFPGLGQLIQGRILAAVVFWFAWLASLAACLIVVGFVLAPLVYLWAIIDAARYKPSPGRQGGGSPMTVLAIAAVLVAIPVGGLLAIVSLGALIGPPPNRQDNSVASEQHAAIVLPDSPTVEQLPALENDAVMFRTWTSASGKFTVNAKLASRDAESVVLEKTDGQTVTVAIDQLSAADREWLQQSHD